MARSEWNCKLCFRVRPNYCKRHMPRIRVEITNPVKAGQVQILRELLEEWNTKVEEVKDALHESYPTIDYHPHYEAIFEDLINQKIVEIQK